MLQGLVGTFEAQSIFFHVFHTATTQFKTKDDYFRIYKMMLWECKGKK